MSAKKNVKKNGKEKKNPIHYFPFPGHKKILEDLTAWTIKTYPEMKEKMKEASSNKQKIEVLTSLYERKIIDKQTYEKEIKQYTNQKSVLPIKPLFKKLFQHLEKLDETFPKISERLE